MRPLLLLSRRPLGRRPVHDWLGEWAGNVILVTTPRAFEGVPSPESVAARFAAVELVDCYTSGAAELAALRLARAREARAITSWSESDVLRAARLRAHLGLPGQSLESALAYRDKFRMKQLVAAAGVPCPAMRRVDEPQDLLGFAESCGLPVVLKPRFGAGSVGVEVLHEGASLREAVAAGIGAAPLDAATGRWLVEEYVGGALVHVDGFMRAGEVLHAWPSRYAQGNYQSLQASAPNATCMLDAADPLAPRLLALSRAVVAALPGPPGVTAFHLEAFHTPDDRLVFCEVACRPGGGLISDGYAHAFGLDLLALPLLVEVGARDWAAPSMALPAQYTGDVLFPPQRGTLQRLPGTCPLPGVLAYEVDGEAGRRYDGPSRTTSFVARALVAGETAQEARGHVRAVEEWWQAEASWSGEAQ